MCFQQTLKAHTIISTKRNDAGSVFQVRGPTTVQRPANHPAEFWSTARHTGACWRIVVGDWHPAPADIPQIDTTMLGLAATWTSEWPAWNQSTRRRTGSQSSSLRTGAPLELGYVSHKSWRACQHTRDRWSYCHVYNIQISKRQSPQQLASILLLFIIYYYY